MSQRYTPGYHTKSKTFAREIEKWFKLHFPLLAVATSPPLRMYVSEEKLQAQVAGDIKRLPSASKAVRKTQKLVDGTRSFYRYGSSWAIGASNYYALESAENIFTFVDALSATMDSMSPIVDLYTYKGTARCAGSDFYILPMIISMPTSSSFATQTGATNPVDPSVIVEAAVTGEYRVTYLDVIRAKPKLHDGTNIHFICNLNFDLTRAAQAYNAHASSIEWSGDTARRFGLYFFIQTISANQTVYLDRIVEIAWHAENK